MDILNLFTGVFSALAEYNDFFRKGMGLIAAAIAILGGLGTAVGQGMAAKGAMEAIGRQPEAVGKIRTSMIVGQVMIETSAIYALIISILIIAKI